MKELQDQGIAFTLDDFGTGYASFRYMQNLPITKIKIDKLFTQSLVTHPKTQKLVEGMIQFGKSMGLYVVAEGVETKEQFELLKEMGVRCCSRVLHRHACHRRYNHISIELHMKRSTSANGALRFYNVLFRFLCAIERKKSWNITSANTSPIAIAPDTINAPDAYEMAAKKSFSTIWRIALYAIPPGTSGMIPGTLNMIIGIPNFLAKICATRATANAPRNEDCIGSADHS